MSSGWWIVLGLVVAFVIWRLSALASRIDRLHHRIELAQESLSGQLVRRSRATEALAMSGLLDPASSVVLARAAANARGCDAAKDPECCFIESELSRALWEVLADAPGVQELHEDVEGRELVDDLAASCRQVALARRFHNDGVQSVRLLRSGRLVRLFHLAGGAPMPAMVEMDDTIPPALGPYG